MNIPELIVVLFSAYFGFFYSPYLEFKSNSFKGLIEKNINPISLNYRVKFAKLQASSRSDRILVRELIENEVSRSIRRVNPLLTTWILVAVLVPTASVLNILILFFKVTQNSRRFSQSLDSLKDDFIPEFYARIAEAQDIVYDLQDSLQVTEETLQGIQDKLDSLSTQDDDLEEYTVEDDKHRLRNRRVIASKS
ncbi:hypothetical protein PL8927_70024 [Planktothrix serta PCC 8927]|uniref:Uncharacterized protein n=1 Tax=Planktothrix serta PCC 8927 TaxID=671068 RepID=A0A7Z9BTI4_9CYAN|nr:hypothetical protein [Planktothrix serta]VXD20815.1 hypothetical protein PL8927_70024 [Planktothrix serta PCC 8927]